jgi:hypothetical protein
MRRKCSLLLILLAASCSRCGEKSAVSAEELLPAHPPGAVVTAPLGSLAGHFAALAGRAASLPGGEQLGDLRKAFAARLGFDPFTREGLLAAGIDPDRGAALGLLSNGKPPEVVIALPLSKPDLFMETAQRLLVERSGYSPLGEGTRQAKIFGRRESQVGVAVVHGYGLIARGADAARLLSQSAGLKPEEALAQDGGLKALRTKLGAGHDLLVYAPAGSPLPARYGAKPLPGDLALALSSSAQGLALRLIAQLPPDPAARVQAALPGGGGFLASLLPADAFARARLGVAAPQVLSVLRQLPQLAPVLEKADLSELVASLAPGASLSLGVERTANLGQLVDYGLDFRRKSPFETVQLVALAQVAEQQQFSKALEALVLRLPSLGAQVARTGDDFQITYSGGKGARFGRREIDGKTIAYVIGGSLKPEDLKAAPADKDPEAAALTQNPGAAARADFGKLYDAIHALPQESFGSGPQSYVTRSLVGQVVDPLRPLRITLGVMANPGSLDASLDLELLPQ